MELTTEQQTLAVKNLIEALDREDFSIEEEDALGALNECLGDEEEARKYLIVTLLAEESYTDLDIVRLVLEDVDYDVSHARCMLKNYRGAYSSFLEFAIECANEILELPTNLEPYFDYEKFAGDLEYDYTVLEEGPNVYIFAN